MIVLGIDPGTRKTGYGVIRKDGSRLTRIDSGVLMLNAKVPFEERLPALFEQLNQIIVTNGPDEGAVESIFFSKNANSALKLGHARGVILLALQQHRLPIGSYPPAQVKRSIVGGGRASKEQIQLVIGAILKTKHPFKEDEADALAIAICHANATRAAIPR
ncbi:MAG: crossover junction endodeoxyribonuclease RuvC [Deltaproteobacteria bacterium]|nr:crossover junction endodeoxyribonuclease RuvC [Deltaproteobacteria bacterium]MBN2671422.1 crossover junction endodeoxyribonuclease RuvC [Deltaproteobacteria bacterium]